METSHEPFLEPNACHSTSTAASEKAGTGKFIVTDNMHILHTEWAVR